MALLLIGVVALAAVAWWVGARMQSPDQAAARAAPPEPSAVTIPIERRVLSATVITRADVVPASSVEVTGPSGDAAGAAAVVTGVFVDRGDAVVAGARLIEVSGRPVFVFAGGTPAYRALRPAMVGSDVAQLQAGLEVLGCDAGASGVYDEATKVCVERLYIDAGYQPMRSSLTETADLAAAEAAVVDAEDALAVAELTLWNAAQPPADSAVAAARSAVNDAQRALDTATGEGADARPAREALDVARASLAELIAPPDTAIQVLAVEQQQRAVERARHALAELQAVSGAIVPFGEVVFVDGLPARVAAMNAVVGVTPVTDLAAQPLVVVASPDLRAHISIPQGDRALVQPGTAVELLDEATGRTVVGTVASIGNELEPLAASPVPAYPAVVDAELPPDWSGRNLRATFSGASTETDVLVVPLAAVTSDAAGATRVQIARGDGTLDTVKVTTGLVAGGYAAVAPTETGALDVGDQVVIG